MIGAPVADASLKGPHLPFEEPTRMPLLKLGEHRDGFEHAILVVHQ